MTRTQWIIGNWKQHKLRHEAEAFAKKLVADLPDNFMDREDALRIGLAPSFTALDVVRVWSRPAGPLWLFAQNIAAQDGGAFTGEIGPSMLKDVGAHGAIIGHSERRKHFQESTSLLAHKLKCALRADLLAVFCVGEELTARKQEKHEDVIHCQLAEGLGDLPRELCNERLILAYEPVWAIGTGETATPEQANTMHQCIRTWMEQHFGSRGADRSILYGGSVKPNNAAELMANLEVDGLLIGGASLDLTTFFDIIRLSIPGS